jgi:hypothetical protein
VLPAGRVGTADDLAEAIWLLLTNGFVTGAVLPVDGGHRLAAPRPRAQLARIGYEPVADWDQWVFDPLQG